jgi:hypothetical protein
MNVVTIPVAAHAAPFHWELDLFWFCHQRVYGEKAAARAHAIFINCNEPGHPRAPALPWPISVPHTVCYSVHDWAPVKELKGEGRRLSVPLNIQLGLQQILHRFRDDEVIELMDCDMLHFRPRPDHEVAYGKLYVCDAYEDWHLKSLSDHKNVIERYFENGGRFYNGGFVPIVGRVSTFKRILPTWIDVHLDILKQPYPPSLFWWAGMFALQAACEKNKVQMVAKDTCYIPGFNELLPQHYVAHYSIDKRFDKSKYPAVRRSTFQANLFYGIVSAWMDGQRAEARKRILQPGSP